MKRWSRFLTSDEYLEGLRLIEPHVSPIQRRLLVEQYNAPERQVTSPQLAALAEIEGGYSVVNSLYGQLGRIFCDRTGNIPDVRESHPNKGKERLWATWSSGWSGPNGFVWQMLPEVAIALEQLGWVTTKSSLSKLKTPTVKQFVEAFRTIAGRKQQYIRLLEAHYNEPQHTVTATRLAKLIGYKRYSVANSQYGRLARLVGEYLDYKPNLEQLGTLVQFEKHRHEWHWIMRSEVVEALEQLQWVSEIYTLTPEENAAKAFPMVEGAVCQVVVNAYERNPQARRDCIATHGTTCCICGFNFGKIYGNQAEGYIHVHHLRPISEIGCEYIVDPVVDLRPVCPNCHAVLHIGGRCRTIEEVQNLIARQKTDE